MKLLAFALVLTMAAVTAPGAQAPAAVPPPAPAAPPADLPSPPADYTYSPGGRRDPFMSLTQIGAPITAPTGAIAKGAADLLVDELTVRGIVFSTGSYVAMVSGPGARQTFTVKAGSRLFDGTVQSITSDAVVILQQVSDPLSLQKQREVRKLLRTQEEGK
jgi:Tfp pilus assembly protein PilP